MNYEYGLSGKWLELLEADRAERETAAYSGIPMFLPEPIFGAIQAVAHPLGVEVVPVSMRDAGEIEHAVVAFARSANGGMIIAPSASVSVHRDLIISWRPGTSCPRSIPSVTWRPAAA